MATLREEQEQLNRELRDLWEKIVAAMPATTADRALFALTALAALIVVEGFVWLSLHS